MEDVAKLKQVQPEIPSSLDYDIDLSLENATEALISEQDQAGYWCFELEADCTITAEYIIMMHFMDEIDHDLQEKLSRYLRQKQCEHGGWPLYYGGDLDISCSVKCYYALKLAGDSTTSAHMLKARHAILAHGGAAKSNVFTRILLSFFKQVPKTAIPFMPVEALLFPKWFPVHTSKVSYWSRTVMIPLFILCSLKAEAKNPTNTHIRELFIVPPEQESNYFPSNSILSKAFLYLDKVGKFIENIIPKIIRHYAVKRAHAWCIERLNGEDGLGAIFPAKVNVYKALALLGYAPDHRYRVQAKRALQKLIVHKKDYSYCQPCLSPVWDTALAAMALIELDSPRYKSNIKKSLDWLKSKQLTDHHGDWKEKRPELAGGGWPFQFTNDYYPDLDDTAVVACAMHKFDSKLYASSITRAANWIRGMQSKNGGFAAFDVDNTYYYLNEIPFADHGALLDPPTVDVSARCAGLFAVLKRPADKSCLEHSIGYIANEQESDGSWFGRWGTNYIYGTWSVLMCFEELGMSVKHPMIVKAVSWLKAKQNHDGGWGEDNGSYFSNFKQHEPYSTIFHTALAVLALMAAREQHSPEVKTGINYLLAKQSANGLWTEPWFTAPGFPRVFYLKYHGYTIYFPLWALAKYKTLTTT